MNLRTIEMDIPKTDKTNVYIVSGLIFVAFVLNFLSEITFGMFRLGVLDEIGSMIILSTGVLTMTTMKRRPVFNMDFLVLFGILTGIYILFYAHNFLSFVYEYYKLFIFLIFIPVLKFYKSQGLKKMLNALFWFFIVVLAVNLVFIALQYGTNNKILGWIGYDELRVSGWERKGRYTGLFDVSTLGSTALLMMLLNVMTNKNKKNFNILMMLGTISVIFSSSKASYVIFILWIIVFFRKYLIKHIIQFALILGLLISVFVIYTYDAIQAKIVQYGYFIEKIGNPNLINLTDVEQRALFWAESLKIAKEQPFGIGFGTFGDTSAKLNPNPYKMHSGRWEAGYVYMSDSTLAHLIAEQGLMMFFYFMVIFFPLFFGVKRKYIQFSVLLLIFYIVQIFFTMGFSSGSWPMIFALVYAIIYYSKKFDDVLAYA